MPALNYSDQFAPKVESGDKRQTIRALRKRPIKTGDILYHFHGLRHPGCRRLGYSIAEEVMPIKMHARLLTVPRRVVVKCDGEWRRIGPRTLFELAEDDGFDSVDAFFAWFNPGNGSQAFRGQLIRWPKSWTPATCPQCGDTSIPTGGLLWCTSCDHRWHVEGI